MLYAVLQTVIIAAALAFSLQHLARKLRPHTVKRLMQSVFPGVEAKAPEAGCGDSGGCGTCNACGNIAAMLRDLPPANR